MTTATAHRKTPAPTPHHVPLGCGDLHLALAAQEAAAHLSRFARDVGCSPSDISTPDGKGIDILRVFDVMRARGYLVDTPIKPQAQPRRHEGLTTWTVKITLPNSGPSLMLGFYEPVAPK